MTCMHKDERTGGGVGCRGEGQERDRQSNLYVYMLGERGELGCRGEIEGKK